MLLLKANQHKPPLKNSQIVEKFLNMINLFTFWQFFCIISHGYQVDNDDRLRFDMNKNLFIAVGKRIRQVREALGLTQVDFVKPLKRKSAFLSQIENGTKKNPGVRIFFQISFVYNVSMDYLFHGTPPMFLNPKINIDKDKREYIEDIESVEDLVWLFERSKFFKDSIMGYAGKFKYENDVLIKKSIDRYRKKSNQEVKNEQVKSKINQGKNKKQHPL
jgi:transcriptional regulator with XRE-family HTH domain